MNHILMILGTMGIVVNFMLGAHRTMPRAALAFFGCVVAAFAVVSLIQGEMLDGILYAGLTGLFAWAWWKRRPPRKRHKSKALAKIRDLGHRLVLE